jgi:hypothetical protein
VVKKASPPKRSSSQPRGINANFVRGTIAPFEVKNGKTIWENFFQGTSYQGEGEGVLLKKDTPAGFVLPLFPATLGQRTQGKLVYRAGEYILDGTPTDSKAKVGGKGRCMGFIIKEPKAGDLPNCCIYPFGIMVEMDLPATTDDRPTELTVCFNELYRGCRSRLREQEWASRSEQDKRVPAQAVTFTYPEQLVKGTVLTYIQELEARRPHVGARIISSTPLFGKTIPKKLLDKSFPLPGLGNCATIGPFLVATAECVLDQNKFRKLCEKLLGKEQGTGNQAKIKLAKLAARIYRDATSSEEPKEDDQFKSILQRLRNSAADTANEMAASYPNIMCNQQMREGLRTMGLPCGPLMHLALSKETGRVIKVTNFVEQTNDGQIHQVATEYRGSDSCQGEIHLLHAPFDLSGKGPIWGVHANHFTLLPPGGRQLIKVAPDNDKWWSKPARNEDAVDGLAKVMQAASRGSSKGKKKETKKGPNTKGQINGAGTGGLPRTGPLRFQQVNPKLALSKSRERYEMYKTALTIEDAEAKGMTRADLKYDCEKGYAKLGTAPATSHDPETATPMGGAAQVPHPQDDAGPPATAAMVAPDNEPAGTVGGATNPQ